MFDGLLVWRKQLVYSLLVRLSSRTLKLARRCRLHTLSLFFNVFGSGLLCTSVIIGLQDSFSNCHGLALLELGGLLLSRRWLLGG